MRGVSEVAVVHFLHGYQVYKRKRMEKKAKVWNIPEASSKLFLYFLFFMEWIYISFTNFTHDFFSL